MRRWLLVLAMLLVGLRWGQEVTAREPIYFFYGVGCPHCANVETYFDEEKIDLRYPLEKREIYGDAENARLFARLMARTGLSEERWGVPAIVMGTQAIVGDTPIIEGFETAANAYLGQAPVPVGVDPVEVEERGLDVTPWAVMAGALVDAINPCAFAVLIILMATILRGGNRKRALYAGLAFATSIFVSYLLMGLGLYSALGLGALTGQFMVGLGILAMLLGLFNLKDFWWYGKGFVMEVPMSWRPRLKTLIGSVTNPRGAFLVGFVVSLFLLPCTSGPYVVVLGMLAKAETWGRALVYLVLYNVIFVAPMVLITLAVYRGYDPQKAEAARQKQLRILHLVAGLVMMALGGWLLFTNV
jgi:cytochrome c biogenesis protein CcdA/glutaredoxin